MIRAPDQIRCFVGAILLVIAASALRAEYHNFNTQSGADGIVQEVRWPYWAETTYNAIYSQYLSGSDSAQCYFYGGTPSSPPFRLTHPLNVKLLVFKFNTGITTLLSVPLNCRSLHNISLHQQN